LHLSVAARLRLLWNRKLPKMTAIRSPNRVAVRRVVAPRPPTHGSVASRDQ